MDFRAPARSLVIGAPVPIFNSPDTVELAVACVPEDDACGTNAGGAVVLTRVTPRAGFLFVRVLDAWDARPAANAGAHVAIANDRIAVSMGDVGVMIASDVGSHSPTTHVLRAAEALVGFAGEQALVLSPTTTGFADVPPRPQ